MEPDAARSNWSARIREIAADSLAAMRRRPRLVFLGACLVVLVASWWGTVYFADRLLTTLPDKSGPLSPLPLTEADIQQQIDEAKRINDELRAQREARAYAHDMLQGPGADSLGGTGPGGDAVAAPVGVGALARRAPDPNAFVATDSPAEPIYTVKAEMPDLARQAGAEGTVVIQALVGTDGRVSETRILKSIPVLNGAAEEAVRRWRFKPAEAGGTPVATWVSVPMTFRR